MTARLLNPARCFPGACFHPFARISAGSSRLCRVNPPQPSSSFRSFWLPADAKYTHRHTKQHSFGSDPGAAWLQAVEGSDAVPQSGILQPSPGATPSPLAASVQPAASSPALSVLRGGRWQRLGFGKRAGEGGVLP